MDQNYFLQVFSEEWEYIVEKKRVSKYISDDLDISSDYSNKKFFDKEEDI